MVDLEPDKLRDIPGWEKAPIHICMGADCRGLTFCCKPGYSLTFGFKCSRDEALKDLELSPEDFIKIKEEFSKENDWDSDIVCFGSISYCCMRKGGCSRRDPALHMRYPDKTREEFMKIYYEKKKELAQKILEFVSNNGCKEKVEPYLDLFEN